MISLICSHFRQMMSRLTALFKAADSDKQLRLSIIMHHRHKLTKNYLFSRRIYSLVSASLDHSTLNNKVQKSFADLWRFKSQTMIGCWCFWTHSITLRSIWQSRKLKSNSSNSESQLKFLRRLLFHSSPRFCLALWRSWRKKAQLGCTQSSERLLVSSFGTFCQKSVMKTSKSKFMNLNFWALRFPFLTNQTIK